LSTSDSKNSNEIIVKPTNVEPYLPRCHMTGVVTVDEKGDRWQGSCKKAGIYEIDIRRAGSKRYGHAYSCEEHLEIAKKQGEELELE